MATVTLTGQVTLPAGLHIPATGSVTITQATLIGSDRTPIDMAVYPHMAYTRLYGAPGKGIPSVAKLAAGVLGHVSFKDPPSATMVNAAMTVLTRPVIWTYHHEPEGDLTAAAYISGWLALVGLVAAHPNSHFVTLVEVFTRYAQVHGKTGPDGQPATWQNMWSGCATGIGFDCELDHTISGYPNPATFFAPLLAAAHTLNVPAYVPELGWTANTGDTNSVGLAAWYTACAAYLASVGAAGVAAYDAAGTTGDYRLTGLPLTAWQNATARQ